MKEFIYYLSKFPRLDYPELWDAVLKTLSANAEVLEVKT